MNKLNSYRLILYMVLIPCFAATALVPLMPAEGVTFKPKGSPQKTAAGASRGICLSSIPPSQRKIPQSNFAALIPSTEVELTASVSPTILVNVPESEARQVELTLWDEDGKGIYQTNVAITGEPGIVSFKFPSAFGSLDVGKKYKWNAALICDRNERQRDVVLEGFLQRVEVSSALKRKLESAEPLQKAKLYAANGFWYDTVATLAEVKRSRPQDTLIVSEWQELLQSVGLTKLSQALLVNCCQAQN